MNESPLIPQKTRTSRMLTSKQRTEIQRWFWKRRNMADRLRIALWRIRQDGVLALRSGLLGPPFGRPDPAASQLADAPHLGFLNNPHPELETSRLRLRGFDLPNLDRLIELFEPDAGGDPAAPRYWTIEYILMRELLTANHTWIIQLKATGECLGHCGVTEMQIDGVIEPEIGYRVGERFQGQGYATEAACAVRDYLFRQGVHRVISAIAADNIASQRVALKNGMRREKRAEWQGQSVEIYAADRVSAEHPRSE